MAEDRRPEGIGLRLKALRLAFGLDQKEMAGRCGMPLTTYNNYERAQSQPRLDYARRIVDEFGVTLDWIYDGRAAGLPIDLHQKLRQTAA